MSSTMSSSMVLEVVAHFHRGPLDQPGLTRILSADQDEYAYLDDLSSRTGDYRAVRQWCSYEWYGRCFEWTGWRS